MQIRIPIVAQLDFSALFQSQHFHADYHPHGWAVPRLASCSHSSLERAATYGISPPPLHAHDIYYSETNASLRRFSRAVTRLTFFGHFWLEEQS